MKNRALLQTGFFGLLISGLFVLAFNTGCGIYSFTEKGTVPDSVKTFRVNFIENRAPYVNPQLSPNLTDRLKQTISRQTRLISTTSEDAHWDINGNITDYSVSTTGVTSQNGRSQTSINRLTVTVSISLLNKLRPLEDAKEYTVSRSFDFSANQSLQQAENALLDEMIRNLTDEIFNRLFSDW